MKYVVVVSERPPRQGLAAVVGPFARHDLAVDWADENVKGLGWQIVPVVARAQAERVYGRRKRS